MLRNRMQQGIKTGARIWSLPGSKGLRGGCYSKIPTLLIHEVVFECEPFQVRLPPGQILPIILRFQEQTFMIESDNSPAMIQVKLLKFPKN